MKKHKNKKNKEKINLIIKKIKTPHYTEEEIMELGHS